ncbi:MAG: dTMP kinase [Candidatus Pacearchaeota archaeon]|nr:dTMP kinase [Candidatus Pacearchaeota archaeon]
MLNEKKGKFIVFEGLDGSGKTLQMLKTASFLFDNYKKYEILCAKEPTYMTKSGKLIRKKLAHDKDPKKQGKLFRALYVKDRAEHNKKIILPALKYGCIVLCDRYSHSTFAYQQAQGDVSFQEVLNEHKKYKIRRPDLTLIFDVPAIVAIQRIQKGRRKNELFEKTLFLEEVRHNYLKLKRFLPKDNIIVINGDAPVEEIFAKVQKEVEKII